MDHRREGGKGQIMSKNICNYRSRVFLTSDFVLVYKAESNTDEQQKRDTFLTYLQEEGIELEIQDPKV